MVSAITATLSPGERLWQSFFVSPFAGVVPARRRDQAPQQFAAGSHQAPDEAVKVEIGKRPEFAAPQVYNRRGVFEGQAAARREDPVRIAAQTPLGLPASASESL